MEKTQHSRDGAHPKGPRSKRTPLIWVAVAAIIIVVLGTLIVLQIIPSPTSPEDDSLPGGSAAPQAGILSDDARRLVGKWVRTDTPYVIEIMDANDDGTLQAAYYNPRSINVSRAEARYTGGNLEVFVELRDINYPGSTYTLTYDRAQDILYGTYFQATMRQTYEVAFTRQRSTP